MDVAVYPVYDIKDIWHILERVKKTCYLENLRGNIMTDGRVLLKKQHTGVWNVWGFHNGVFEDPGLLTHDSMSLNTHTGWFLDSRSQFTL